MNKLLAGTTTLINCPLEKGVPAVNGDTADGIRARRSL